MSSLGNSGIGYETCLQLAINGVRVYIASRSLERISKAIDDMKKSKPKKTLDLRPLHIDMQSLKSVKLAAEEFLSKERRLDLLINNAGVSTPHRSILTRSNPTISETDDTPSQDHGRTVQTHTRWLRNPMANKPPSTLPLRQHPPPNPQIHRHSQHVQNPRPHRQRLKRRRLPLRTQRA